jgi:polyribonucleotide nucleotidyltransferase
MLTIQINPEKIGKVIGPGGKMINKIQDETGATIDIEDDGTIYIASADAEGAEAAKAYVESITEEVEVGKTYQGAVVSIVDFGAFLEIMPGQDGLVHVSELSDEYVKDPKDVVNVGDTMKVKVINVDNQGRVKLSRKAIICEEKGIPYEPASSGGKGGRDRKGGGRGGDRKGGRGGRGGRGGGGGRRD